MCYNDFYVHLYRVSASIFRTLVSILKVVSGIVRDYAYPNSIEKCKQATKNNFIRFR
jgi:hypothetical protein